MHSHLEALPTCLLVLLKGQAGNAEMKEHSVIFAATAAADVVVVRIVDLSQFDELLQSSN